MAGYFHYTNRKGKTYYLHFVTTKKSEIRYVMKRMADGCRCMIQGLWQDLSIYI